LNVTFGKELRSAKIHSSHCSFIWSTHSRKKKKKIDMGDSQDDVSKDLGSHQSAWGAAVIMLLLAVVVTILSKELDHGQRACMYVCMYVLAHIYIYVSTRTRGACRCTWTLVDHGLQGWRSNKFNNKYCFRENFEARCTSRDARLSFRFWGLQLHSCAGMVMSSWGSEAAIN